MAQRSACFQLPRPASDVESPIFKIESAGTGVVESAEWIVKNATLLRINNEGIDTVARRILHLLPKSTLATSFILSPWASHPLHPIVPPPTTASINELDTILNWIFLVSVLNFSFWSELDIDKRFAVTWNGKKETGYWSLLACLHRALAENIPITTPSFFATITPEIAAHVFRSDTSEPIPLLPQRVQVMREAGNLLCQKYGGTFRRMLEAAHSSAVTLVHLVTELKSFRDEAVYKGRQVRLYKRAQILVAETWAAFAGDGPGNFPDISALTMFADYRVPQILHSMQTLTYSSTLLSLLHSNTYFPSGSSEEIEIRGASIIAVERIRTRLGELLACSGRAPPTAVELDFWLWDLAKDEEAKALERGEELVPHHQTRSVYY